MRLHIDRGDNVKGFRIVWITLAAVACLAGCTVARDWTATGGSRADGTVELSYQYGMFQVPRENETQGVDLATLTCSGWGYSGAQPFGGEIKQCGAQNSSGCISWLVTRKYQCLGAPGSAAANQ